MRCNVAGETVEGEIGKGFKCGWKGVRSGKVQWWMQCGLCRSIWEMIYQKNHMEHIQFTGKS